MIGYLQGKLLSKNEETSQVILLVGDLGYEVSVPRRSFDLLVASSSADVKLWIHSHIREDAFTLFGFANETEKHFFRLLLSVSGLGPKTALSLIGEHGAERLSRLIESKATDEISEAPGVGKKLAQRLALELSGKIEKMNWAFQLGKLSGESPRSAPEPAVQLRSDLISALQNLGYPPNQVKYVLDKVLEREESPGFESGLRAALKELSGRPVTMPAAVEPNHG